MDRTANIVAGYADQLRKGAGRHLYFDFMDRMYSTTRFHRERCVDPEFELTSNMKKQLREWILAKNWPSPDRIRITEGKTDVVVSWRPTTSKHFRVFSRMPPVAYDLEDNPVYKALRKKTRQVKGAAPGTLRCVFLVDAGCDLLRQLRPMGVGREIGGETVIRHALRKLSVDIVCVFSPNRERSSGFSLQSRVLWKVTSYDRRTGVPNDEYDQLKALAGQLPRPRFEGYQARDLHVQGLFGPTARGWYLPTIVSTSAGGKMTIKLSARLVQECLAGRIDAATLQHHAFGKNNFFDTALARGSTIRAVRFESAGLDEDDDYLVFELDFDWAASPLKPIKKP